MKTLADELAKLRGELRVIKKPQEEVEEFDSAEYSITKTRIRKECFIYGAF